MRIKVNFKTKLKRFSFRKIPMRPYTLEGLARRLREVVTSHEAAGWESSLEDNMNFPSA